MDFFDSLINEVNSTIENSKKSAYRFNESERWADLGYNQVVLQRDTAFELNGTGFSLVTSKAVADEIIVVGNDISSIASSGALSRIAIVQVDDTDDAQQSYDLIKKIEFVKYHCFPDGYMMRSASSSFKESVRVSKKSLLNGLTFEKIGNLLISEYKKIPSVKGVKMIFVTDERINYSEFEKIAEKNREITETLNKVMNNLVFDCTTCNLKPICDEVEGMRELHFKSAKGEM